MTKKDYELIADTLAECFTRLERDFWGVAEGEEFLGWVVDAIIPKLKEDNPSFDETKFRDYLLNHAGRRFEYYKMAHDDNEPEG